MRMPPRTGPLSEEDIARVTDAVRGLRARADVIVVYPHWGTQYVHEPVPEQRDVGRRLVEAGATAVIGSHPHWVQGMDLHQGRLIAHSLGNFVFDMTFSTQVQQGMALELVFWGDRPMAARLWPYRDRRPLRPRWLDGDRRPTASSPTYGAPAPDRSRPDRRPSNARSHYRPSLQSAPGRPSHGPAGAAALGLAGCTEPPRRAAATGPVTGPASTGIPSPSPSTTTTTPTPTPITDRFATAAGQPGLPDCAQRARTGGKERAVRLVEATSSWGPGRGPGGGSRAAGCSGSPAREPLPSRQ